jgi:hypothetical protein
MKQNQAKLILILVTLMTTQLPNVYGASDAPILQVSVENIHLTAGELNTIQINLKNTGDYKIFDIESYLTSTVQGITVLSGQQHVISNIDAKKTKSYTPEVYIDETVPVGVCTLSLNVRYGRTGAVLQSTVNVPIGIIIDESYVPKIKFAPIQDNIKVKSGTENQVSFTFTNNWEKDVTDLNLTLSSPTNMITITDGINSNLNQLGVDESFTVMPTLSILEGTPLGTYSIAASASYRDEMGTRYYQRYQLPVSVDSAAAVRDTIVVVDSMDVLQDSVKPGDVYTVTLRLKCIGADAYDLIGGLELAQNSMISPISPTRISLGDVSVDSFVELRYDLLASGDVSAGQYVLPVRVSYTTSKGLPGMLVETFTLLVDGLIEFDLLDIQSELFPVGTVSEVESDLLLIGTESIEFVSIGVVENDVFERVSGSDEYIGAVDPDSPIPFDVSFRVKDDVEFGSHALDLVIKYRDHLNTEHEESLSFDLEIGQPVLGTDTDGGPPIGTVQLIVGAIVMIVIGYYLYTKIPK